jgi:hypothetical protein
VGTPEFLEPSHVEEICPLAFTSLGTLNASKTMSINSLSGGSGLIVTTGTGITGRTVNMGSGAITLTSGAVSGWATSS